MKCSKNNLMTVVSWSVAVGVLLLMSCSGTAVSPLGEGVEADNDDMGYAQAFLENGAIVMQSPPSPRQASEPAEIELDDSIIDESEIFNPLLFELAHIPLVSGENVVDHQNYLYQSEDVYNDDDDFLEYAVLESEAGGMSFVTYGFREIPADENITRVEVGGEGTYGDGASCGLYIGVGDPEADTYKWFGPFKTGEDWTANTPFMDNTNDLQRAYVTLAVANGDEVSISRLVIHVNGIPEIEPPELMPEELLDPFPDPLPPDWLGPEF